MKTGPALLLSAVLAALCGSSALVDANGVCYDPDHTTGKNAASVTADIATIKSKGFSYVRTYISKFGNTKMVEQLAASGLKVVAGVPYHNSKGGDYTEQLEAAVAAAKLGNVVTIMIGNENLAGLGSVPGELIQAIKDLKARVPGVKVGTVQRNTEFIDKIGGLADLVAACDVIGVNIHPYFMGTQKSAQGAMETTKSQWNLIIGSGIPGIADKLILGETGWPSGGLLGGNQGTVDGAGAYFSAYKAWSAALPADKKFYFQLFDQPYKPESYEKAYGLVTFDAQDKFGGASVPAATTAAPTTAPTTPAPSPASISAPSPTPEASAKNGTSTGSTSGSSATDLKSAGSSGSLSEAGHGSLEAASTASSSSATTETSETTTTTGTAEDETATGNTDRTTVDTPFVNTDKSSGETTEANTQSSAEGSSGVTVAFVVVAGCAAVLGAFGFIYHTRKKAQALEEAEGKMSFAVTPHGGCVL